MPVAAVYKYAGLEFQSNGAYCGPASAVGVLRSLQISGFSQENILSSGSVSFDKVRNGGITIEELAAVLREKSGGEATIIRDIDFTQFVSHMTDVNSTTVRYIINFHRPSLSGDGSGHHSPVAAYLSDREQIMVLDVNEKYGPFLIDTRKLFDSMDTIDRRTGRKRGLIKIECR